MLRRQVMAGLALLMIAVAGYGQTSLASTKSYDLYSWKIKGHWYYSILPHSNGARSYEEITANTLVRRDTTSLETELSKLPAGSEVFWKGDAPAAARKTAVTHATDFKHPSRPRIKRIKEYCDKKGITLKLV